MSDAKIYYSKTNDPTKWANEDYDVIKFATPEDAKKAETMFNDIQAALTRWWRAASPYATPEALREALERLEVLGPVVYKVNDRELKELTGLKCFDDARRFEYLVGKIKHPEMFWMEWSTPDSIRAEIDEAMRRERFGELSPAAPRNEEKP